MSRISAFNDAGPISVSQLSDIISNHEAEISYFEWYKQEEAKIQTVENYSDLFQRK